MAKQVENKRRQLAFTVDSSDWHKVKFLALKHKYDLRGTLEKKVKQIIVALEKRDSLNK